MSIQAKEFLAKFLALKEFGHIFRGTNKSLDGQKIGDSILLNKNISTALMEWFDFVLQFNFTIEHIPGKISTAADFFVSIGNEPLRERFPENQGRYSHRTDWGKQWFNRHCTKRTGPSRYHRPTRKYRWKVRILAAWRRVRPYYTKRASSHHCVVFFYANDLHKDTTLAIVAQLNKSSRIFLEQDSDPL